MKNTILYLLIFALGIIVLIQSTCNIPNPILNDNTNLFNRIDSLNQRNDSLKLSDDSLTVNYSIATVLKDSFVIRLKTRYLTVYDTISQSVVDCLPKSEVDSLIITYEGVIGSAEAVIEVKDEQIYILDKMNSTKDTIIENYQSNEVVLKKQIKKEKRKKWLWFGVGTATGVIIGKLF